MALYIHMKLDFYVFITVTIMLLAIILYMLTRDYQKLNVQDETRPK